MPRTQREYNPNGPIIILDDDTKEHRYAGPLMITFGGAYENHGLNTFDSNSYIVIDTITGVTPNPLKNVRLTPIVSKGVESTFPVEVGSTLSYSISFIRNHPLDADDESTDMSKWSNRKWYEEITKYVNRWQMRTDGNFLYYNTDLEPLFENGEPVYTTDSYGRRIYVPGPNYGNPINPNAICIFKKPCYIKTLTRKYSNDFNTVINGTIEIVVGRMHIKTSNAGLIRAKQVFIECILSSGALSTYPLTLLTGSDSADSNETVGFNFGVLNSDGTYTIPDQSMSLGFYTDSATISGGTLSARIHVTAPMPPSSWSTYASYTTHSFNNWSLQYSVDYGNTYVTLGDVNQGNNCTVMVSYSTQNIPGSTNEEKINNFTKDIAPAVIKVKLNATWSTT